MMLEGELGIPALGLALQTPRAQTSTTATFGTAMCDAVKTPGLDNILLPSPLRGAHAHLKKPKTSPILKMLIPQTF